MASRLAQCPRTRGRGEGLDQAGRRGRYPAMRRFVIPVRTHLDYVESRGWLLGKLGIGVLVIAGAVFLWGPLVAGRPHAERLAGWLAWAAIALVALGVVVRVAEAIWGMA